MTLKINQPLLAKNLLDGFTVPVSEAGAATVAVGDNVHTVRRARLTLTNFSIAVTQALDYGGSKLVDLPDRNMLLLGVEVDCTVVKQGNTNGIVAATDLDMAVGTATASNATLASAMINVIEKVDIDTDALSVAFEAHSNDNATSTFPLRVADGASTALFMNISCAITADSSVTVSGTIDIYYVDLGNLYS
jgi:hypothetical protein